MKTILIFLVTGLLSAQAKSLSFETNLVGPMIQSELKDQVCYLTLNGGSAVCSGVRLSNDYVLSAGHCARTSEGKKNSITLECNGEQLQVEKVFESDSFVASYTKGTIKSNVDFSLIKLKNSKKNFTPKFHMLQSFSDYQAEFLNSDLTFNESTHCEFHGYGTDKSGRLGTLHSTSIETTLTYNEKDYHVQITSNDEGAIVQSPLLPDESKNWLYSSARPGDSGGPLFCLAKSGEWVLSGIASTWDSGFCPDELQDKNPKKVLGIFKAAKLRCSDNHWGLPSVEQLEKIFGITL